MLSQTIPSCTHTALAVLLATALTACHSPGTTPMNDETPKNDIEFKQNSNPKRAYRIVMEIENAPGPFGLVQGAAQYDVTNEEECGVFSAMAGGYNREVKHVALQWEKLSDTVFATTVYADLMLDDDYFGRGVCHWKFTHANASLSATGSESETMFQPDLSSEEIESGQAVRWFFWRGRYPVDSPLPSNGIGFATYGYKSPEEFKPDLRGQLFSIALSATEAR